ncbi:MAG TPA: biotin--[acetyl-CoA-carboxylase] ligase [Caproiciproducens sp.]|nr:biotin--[acetyl-CoA-carboxylase] ligase [Caproiciproducens sp.]
MKRWSDEQMKKQILHFLRENGGFVSGEELSEKMGVSRTAVWKYVKALREEGYGIESVTNRGYRLVSRPDIMTEEEIASGLNTKFLAKKIYCFKTIDSTNEEAKRQAMRGAPNGSLFVAERQTGGKGRLGRRWDSPAGEGLWFSVLLRPNVLPEQVSALTLLAGLATCEAARALTGCDIKIKWPNDLVSGNKKLCGILTEMTAEMERVDFVVIGTGVNVNNTEFPEELQKKATSLKVECGRSVSRSELLQAVLERMEYWLFRLYEQGTEILLPAYRPLCISLNREVGFTRNGKPETGTAVDLTPEGELMILCHDGAVVPVCSGEVTVQGIYGQ